MTYLLETRHNSIQFNRFRITCKRFKTVYYSIRIMLAFIYSFTIIEFVPEDQETLYSKVLEKVPCPADDYFKAEEHFVLCDNEAHFKLLLTLVTIMGVSEGLQMMFFTTCCLYYLFYSTKQFTSKKTRQMQITFFRNIVLQISIPVLSFLPTNFVVTTSTLAEYNNQGMSWWNFKKK